MASILHSLALTLVFAFLLFTNPTFSALSPSPSPHIPPESISAPPESRSPSPSLPDSPPSPPLSDLSPNSPSPAPSPVEDDGESSLPQFSPSPGPAPAPEVAADIGHEDQTIAGDLETEDSSGGMNGGEKAGIAIGVVAAGCIVGLAAVVFKKRQQNIRRSQYGYETRRDFL